MEEYHFNTYCKTEGCNHKRGHGSSRKHAGTSWRILGLCPCCARELFPYGYHPINGRSMLFTAIGLNCKNWIKEELSNLLIIHNKPISKP